MICETPVVNVTIGNVVGYKSCGTTESDLLLGDFFFLVTSDIAVWVNRPHFGEINQEGLISLTSHDVM